MQYEHTSLQQEIQEVIPKQCEAPLRQMLAEYLGAVLQQEVTEYLRAANRALCKEER